MTMSGISETKKTAAITRASVRRERLREHSRENTFDIGGPPSNLLS